MTEEEWLGCTHPDPLLEYFRFRGRDRKVRLFACACCRWMFRTVSVNPWDVRAVEAAELYADGQLDYASLSRFASETTSDWTAAFACQEAADPDGGVDAGSHAAGNAAYELAERRAGDGPELPPGQIMADCLAAEHRVQAGLMRCLFGNPFRPVAFDPAWRTTAVLGLAETIYADRAFDRLPILADALEDAGCDHPDVLRHCREAADHARGCWVIDGLLGKS
jgi:hypothetical protein